MVDQKKTLAEVAKKISEDLRSFQKESYKEGDHVVLPEGTPVKLLRRDDTKGAWIAQNLAGTELFAHEAGFRRIQDADFTITAQPLSEPRFKLIDCYRELLERQLEPFKADLEIEKKFRDFRQMAKSFNFNSRFEGPRFVMPPSNKGLQGFPANELAFISSPIGRSSRIDYATVYDATNKKVAHITLETPAYLPDPEETPFLRMCPGEPSEIALETPEERKEYAALARKAKERQRLQKLIDSEPEVSQPEQTDGTGLVCEGTYHDLKEDQLYAILTPRAPNQTFLGIDFAAEGSKDSTIVAVVIKPRSKASSEDSSQSSPESVATKAASFWEAKIGPDHSPTPSKGKCEDCKGTGRIQLFSSVVPCDCQKEKP